MTHNMTEFLRITQKLNEKNITPLLMGSLGLEYLTQHDWQAQDIDIHVSGDPRGWSLPDGKIITRWDTIVAIMTSLGYQLVDLHEHKFHKDAFSVGFGVIETLPDFAQVSLADLVPHEVDGQHFLLPTLADYLKIYQASSKDSYRADKNNQKDFAKIAYLENIKKET